jgi:hypothetical protein
LEGLYFPLQKWIPLFLFSLFFFSTPLSLSR